MVIVPILCTENDSLKVIFLGSFVSRTPKWTVIVFCGLCLRFRPNLRVVEHLVGVTFSFSFPSKDN